MNTNDVIHRRTYKFTCMCFCFGFRRSICFRLIPSFRRFPSGGIHFYWLFFCGWVDWKEGSPPWPLNPG